VTAIAPIANQQTAARLWVGRTAHVREKPFRRAFSYRIAMLEIDIDRLEAAARMSRLFSINRFNAIAFHPQDHGDRREGSSLRSWAETRYAEAGVELHGGVIRLVTFPRVLGVGFAPISIWYGHGPSGDLRGVIYEVHNTFGETHAYVCALDPVEPSQSAEKAFFVSPFFDVSGDYRFTLRQTDARMELIVENTSAEGRSHVASLLARPRELSGAAIARWLIELPLSGLGVMFAIHWQALMLFVRGARYHIKPQQRAERTTLVRPKTSAAPFADKPRKRA